MADKEAILVIGAGDATGGAIASALPKKATPAAPLTSSSPRLTRSGQKAARRTASAPRRARKTAKRRGSCCHAGRGTIIFTGATASLRGREVSPHSPAQNMARERGPEGIHVAHPIIDAAIDTAFLRDNFPERFALKDQDGIVQSSSIANAYWNLHEQSRDAWTTRWSRGPDGNVLRPGRANLY